MNMSGAFIHLFLKKEKNIESMMITHNEHSEKHLFTTFTKVIDGRTITVRVYLPTESMESMQEKIERMLHRDIVNAIRQSAV